MLLLFCLQWDFWDIWDFWDFWDYCDFCKMYITKGRCDFESRMRELGVEV